MNEILYMTYRFFQHDLKHAFGRLCKSSFALASSAHTMFWMDNVCGSLTVQVGGFPADMTLVPGSPERLHRLLRKRLTFFCSFSFWVSANFTTTGEEQPSMVCEWCMALMAVMAHCLVEKVTKAQPAKKNSGKWKWALRGGGQRISDAHLC